MFSPVLEHPARRLAEMAAEMDRWAEGLARGGDAWPRLDIEETDGALVMTVDLPGVDREAITIEVDGRQLVLRGEKPRPIWGEGEALLHSERQYGSFERTFALGSMVDRERVTAEFDGGVLTVRLPLVEAARPRRIAVTG